MKDEELRCNFLISPPSLRGMIRSEHVTYPRDSRVTLIGIYSQR